MSKERLIQCKTDRNPCGSGLFFINVISLEQNKAVIEEVTKMINFANNLILDFEKDSDRRISAICRVLGVILLMPTLFYDILNLHSKFIRYFVLTLLVFMSGLMYSILSYHVIIVGKICVPREILHKPGKLTQKVFAYRGELVNG